MKYTYLYRTKKYGKWKNGSITLTPKEECFSEFSLIDLIKSKLIEEYSTEGVKPRIEIMDIKKNQSINL